MIKFFKKIFSITFWVYIEDDTVDNWENFKV